MQMVPPVMMTRTRDSGYCVAMVFARLRTSAMLLQIDSGNASDCSQPLRFPCLPCKSKRQNR
jgi:hypothetical protein